MAGMLLKFVMLFSAKTTQPTEQEQKEAWVRFHTNSTNSLHLYKISNQNVQYKR